MTEQIKEELRKLLKEANYKVYTSLKHVSSSGMFRVIDCLILIDNKPIHINWYIEQLRLYKRHKNKEGLRVSGCGMDMGFSVVYNLSGVLYPKGFRSFHRNAINGMKPSEKGYNWDNDGGYRLKQEWL